MKKLRAKKIGPGYYEVPTPHGTYRVENIPAPKGSGYGSGPNWLIIGPGQDVADASKPTKREAMEYIHYLCTADPDYKPEALPTLEDVELPSDEADREQARQDAMQDPEPSLDDYAKASRIIQSLIPRGRNAAREDNR